MELSRILLGLIRLHNKSVPHRYLTAFGAVRGGHLVEKVVSSRLVFFKSAAGEKAVHVTKG
jgi:hypothetical protein